MAPLILLFLLSPVVSGLYTVEGILGREVTLNCSAGDGSITAVEWTRPDLKPKYVFFYSDGHLDTTYQHPSFNGRVDLTSFKIQETDRELKDGDVSLVLKNLISSDEGTYECWVATGGPSRRKRANIETISTIQLKVTASGSNSKNTMDGDYKDTTKRDGNHTRKHFGLTAVGLTAFGLICSAVVVGMFLWNKKRHTDSNSEPAADEAVGDQLL